MNQLRRPVSGRILFGILVLLLAGPVRGGNRVDTSELREAVTVAGVRAHQAALQAIADANGGIRAAGTPGYYASADYVADQLSNAGFDVTIQEFDFSYFEELEPAELEQTSPIPTVYPYLSVSGFATMQFSGSGDVTAQVEAVDVIIPPAPDANASTSGCESEDFSGFTPGNIALVQRGSCTFALKAQNAENAGAVGVLIFNEGQTGRTNAFLGTLGGPGFGIPIVGTSFAVGEELYNASSASVRLFVNAVSETRQSSNLVAETSGGRDDRVVVVGAHLDSVTAGPGINDDGSGSAAILEIALQMATLGIEPTNKVRFAWWGAEEPDVFGSSYYVGQLTSREIKNISAYLEAHMIGSPNFVRFVYDGDGNITSFPGPNGSGSIERVLEDYFAAQGLATESTTVAKPTTLVGGTAAGAFASVDIPVGGLTGGAAGIKTEEQAAIYGGTAGEQYDPCYHLACDTFDNVSFECLDQMSDAMAHAVLTFAMTKASVNGTGRAGENQGHVDPLVF